MNPLILRGDARKIPLPDESVSAIVTDPPYHLTSGEILTGVENCLSWIAAKVLLPHFRNADSDRIQIFDLAPVSTDVVPLGGVERAGIDSRVGMPVSPVDLDHAGDVRQPEVDDEGEPATIPAESELPDVTDADPIQLGGNFMLQLRNDRLPAFCNGPCRCYRHLGPSLVGVPVIVFRSPDGVSLDAAGPPRDASGIGDDVGPEHDPPADPRGSPGVVALPGTELRAMLALDLRRGTFKFVSAKSASEFRFVLSAVPAKGVGTRPRTRRLPSPPETAGIGEIRDTARGTGSLDHVSLRREIVDRFKSSLPRGGFMGKVWDGSDAVAFDPATWAESLRVLKPGGHLLAFAGTRTSHRVAVAIEDAGFEIRDSIMWIYGTGFPKSLDISKAIDKMAGAERKVVGKGKGRTGDPVASHEGNFDDDPYVLPGEFSITEPATDAARQWQGWGSALKPSHEPVIIARKPFAGNVASNVLAHGTGGINVDAGRIPTGDNLGGGRLSGPTDMSSTCGGPEWDRPWMHDDATRDDHAARTADKVAHAESLGRWPPNTALQHNSDCRLVGVRRAKGNVGTRGSDDGNSMYGGGKVLCRPSTGQPVGYADPDGLETVEVWECSDGCPVKQIDIQSGDVRGATSNGKKAGTGFREGWGEMNQAPGYADSGGASRFFPRFAWDADDWFPFLYCGKASRRERNLGCDALPEKRGGTLNADNDDSLLTGSGNPRDRMVSNHHNTVKPVRFMEWLIRLVVPPGGVLLDPFAGSGSTLVAAVRCGVTAIGLDNDREHGYHAIQAARVRHAVENARPPRVVPDGVLPIPEIRPTRKGRRRRHADGPTLFD
jgi:hypothetical protein